jgi:hypothetical protein
VQVATGHRGANYQAGAGIAASRPHIHDSAATYFGSGTPWNAWNAWNREEHVMGRFRNFVLGLVIAAAATGGACASMGSRSISEVQTNPGKFADKTVTVEGVVTTSWGIPLVPFKVYRVSDGSGEMLVISDNSRIPGKNARVRVRGEVEEFGLFGGRSFGLHIREKSIKFL